MSFACEKNRGRYTIERAVTHGFRAALFDATTGLVYDQRSDTLFVASTFDNMVFGVRHALERSEAYGPGTIVYEDNLHLHGALAMAGAPNGDLLVTNNDVINPDPNQPSEIVEFTKDGQFVKETSVDPNQGGFFGLAVNQGKTTTVFAAFAACQLATALLEISYLPQRLFSMHHHASLVSVLGVSRADSYWRTYDQMDILSLTARILGL